MSRLSRNLVIVSAALFCLTAFVPSAMGMHPWEGQGADQSSTATPQAADSTVPLNKRNLKIDMGDDWTSQAELTWPAEGKGPFPTVILFHGGGIFDMDETQYDFPSQKPVMSTNFLLLAQQLGKKGIAVMRFATRAAKGAYNVDNAQAAKFSVGRFAADGESVITVTLAQPEVDSKRLFLYGWSYGTVVATNLAVFHPSLAGLVLHGAPDEPLATALKRQLLDESTAYLTERIDTNNDGKVSLDEASKLPKVGVITYFLGSLYDSSSTPDKPIFNKDIDKNGDGLIDIQQEFVPFQKAQIASNIASNADVLAWPRTGDIVANLKVPVLLLQGLNDGLVSPDNSQRIAAAAPDRVTLKLYPGLGHSLAKSASPLDDALYSMDQQPIDDMAAWILTTK